MFLPSSLLLLLASLVGLASGSRSFTIANGSFVKDGAPFQIVSGSFHYFRHHPSTIVDRLAKAKACGLNAVQSYISWTLHQPRAAGGFTRLEELTSFLGAVNESGLLLVLRPGPFICAETQGGGLPGWLQAAGAGTVIARSSDPKFLAPLDAWFAVLLPLLRPWLYSNGGPIILAQVGNEEGYWSTDGSANAGYLGHVHDSFVGAWGADAVIIHSTDGTAAALLHGSATPGVYATVDFGPSSGGNGSVSEQVAAHFALEDAANGGAGVAPHMNSEFYVGGFNAVWGSGPYVNDSASADEEALAWYEAILASGDSVNTYMFSGGTNWRLEAGLHSDGSADWQTGPYVPGAPLSEAGDFTDLGVKFCAATTRAQQLRPVAALPPVAPKSHYVGELAMQFFTPLWDAASLLGAEGSEAVTNSPFPPIFEGALGMEAGYVLYAASTRAAPHADGSNWYVRDVRDRAYVFFNGSRIGVLQRSLATPWAPSPPANQTAEQTVILPAPLSLTVLVEAMGRTCFGPYVNMDVKGLPGGFQLGIYAQPYVLNWTATPLPGLVENLTLATLASVLKPLPDAAWDPRGPIPVLYGATWTIDKATTPTLLDTFLDMRGWGKGLVAVNGLVLGRFWSLGPEYSLYVPAGQLRYGTNEIVILETDGVGSSSCSAADGKLERTCHFHNQLKPGPAAPGGVPSVTFREVPVRDL